MGEYEDVRGRARRVSACIAALIFIGWLYWNRYA